MRKLVFCAATMMGFAALTPAYSQGQEKLFWQLSPITIVPDGGGFFDASQSANLGPYAMFGLSADVKHVRAEEAEQKLRPILEDKIRNYINRIDESQSRIEPPKKS